jgi:hypothetical protein
VIGLLLAVVVALMSPPPTAPPDVPPLRSLITPAKVLARYAAALAALVPPHAISFEYVLEQTGARDLLQEHRVIRRGTDQRDEILAVDGRKLDPPAIRITHGRRNRYDVAVLAPKPGAYDFRFIGKVRDAHHEDYVFETTPRVAGTAFRITEVTVDGVTYLPSAIAFATDAHNGTGTIDFGRAENYWVPTVATARATYAKLAAQERITFMSYRFPTALPPGTFERAHPISAIKPAS